MSGAGARGQGLASLASAEWVLSSDATLRF